MMLPSCSATKDFASTAPKTQARFTSSGTSFKSINIVERVPGCPKEIFIQVAEALARNSDPERTGAWCYAVGWTHHTTGVQMIRASAIVQALLGNIGQPGDGILALQSHCSIQGSTDIPSLSIA